MNRKLPSKPMQQAKWKYFLDTYEQTGSLKATIEKCEISWNTYWTWKLDPEFQELWEQHKEELCCRLEREALARAIEGEKEDVYYRGQVVGQRVKKSDELLKLLLQANMPEKYKNNVSVEASGTMKHLHEGAIEQLKTVRLELLNDPQFLEFQYHQTELEQQKSLPDTNPGNICNNGNEWTMDSIETPEVD